MRLQHDLNGIEARFTPFFFFTLVTGPRRSLSLKLSDTRVYEPQIRARLGTTGSNPAPSTLHPAPYTLHPKPQTPNPPPLNPRKGLSCRHVPSMRQPSEASRRSQLIYTSRKSMSLKYEPSSEPLHRSHLRTRSGRYALKSPPTPRNLHRSTPLFLSIGYPCTYSARGGEGGVVH